MAVSDKNVQRFKRAVKQLNSVIADCKKDSPECFVYLDGSATLFLMSGDLQIGEEGVEDTILTEQNLSASGGDW